MSKLSKDMQSLRALIGEAIEKELPAKNKKPKQIHAGMRYATLPGGKRLRPILCLAAAQAINKKTYKKALLPAVAVELFHSYTLVHDDLPAMDNDVLRRGKATVHVKFGEGAAVLIGDALLAQSFAAVLKTGDIKLLEELLQVANSEGVIAGQMDDLDLQEGRKKSSKKILQAIYAKKTAALFVASVRMGAMTQQATKQQLTLLTSYAEKIGAAFQFIDDILDDDKYMLHVYTAQQAEKQARQLIASALEDLRSLPGSTAVLQEITELILNQLA